jgi:mannosyltransferase
MASSARRVANTGLPDVAANHSVDGLRTGARLRRIVRAAAYVGALIGPLGVVALAAALRFHALGAKGLWIDEAYAADLVRLPLLRVWADLAADHVPLYYTLLWGTVRLIGDSEWALRVPSAVAGTVAVAGTWALGRELRLPWAGLLAALLGACSPLAVYWSQEAKPEALWMTLTVISWYLLAAAQRRRRRSLWIAYWLIGVIGVFTFYYHVFVVMAQAFALAGMSWPLSHRPLATQWRRMLSWLLGHATLCALVIPWLILHRERLASDVPTFARAPQLSVPGFLMLNASSLLAGDVWGSASVSPVIYLTILLVSTVIAGLSLHRLPSLSNAGLLALASWIVIPLACAYVLQLLLPAYHTRYLLAVVPAFHLVVGIALAALFHSREAVATAVGLASAAALAFSWNGMTRDVYDGAAFQHQGFREVSAYVQSTPHAGEIVAGDPSWQAPGFRYYLPPTSFPELPGYFRFYLKNSQFLELPPDILDNSERVVDRLISVREAGRPGLWLATYSGYGNLLDAALSTIAEPTGESAEVRGVTVRFHRFRARP